ncbi:18530_t:CDS:2 [Racocetra fulgida]|uniref:18530_t:CDS:1 n=1 Tax=Racocetra fulgida TaxID=60492 RepID=A0A9N9DQV3_9GLOM|nr:18530_t:CDS:2 [Racocetra fulgida]
MHQLYTIYIFDDEYENESLVDLSSQFTSQYNESNNTNNNNSINNSINDKLYNMLPTG